VVRQLIWFDTGAPWLTVALVLGLVFGYLGYHWSGGNSRIAGTVMGLAFVAEPLLYAAGMPSGLNAGRYPLSAWNVGVWTVEALIALVVLVLLRRRGAPPVRARRQPGA
jgi:hypothetical protein